MAGWKIAVISAVIGIGALAWSLHFMAWFMATMNREPTLRAMCQAAVGYREEKGAYPATLDELLAFCASKQPPLPCWRETPWGAPFAWRASPDGQEAGLVDYGKDQIPSDDPIRVVVECRRADCAKDFPSPGSGQDLEVVLSGCLKKPPLPERGPVEAEARDSADQAAPTEPPR